MMNAIIVDFYGFFHGQRLLKSLTVKNGKVSILGQAISVVKDDRWLWFTAWVSLL